MATILSFGKNLLVSKGQGTRLQYVNVMVINTLKKKVWHASLYRYSFSLQIYNKTVPQIALQSKLLYHTIFIESTRVKRKFELKFT